MGLINDLITGEQKPKTPMPLSSFGVGKPTYSPKAQSVVHKVAPVVPKPVPVTPKETLAMGFGPLRPEVAGVIKAVREPKISEFTPSKTPSLAQKARDEARDTFQKTSGTLGALSVVAPRTTALSSMISTLVGLQYVGAERNLQHENDLDSSNISKRLSSIERQRMSYLEDARREDVAINAVGKDQYEDPYKFIKPEYSEPGSFSGQLLEGVAEGYYSSIKTGAGNTLRMIGLKIGSPPLMEKGQEIADNATIHLLKNPELMAPKNLKKITDGGYKDSRTYGRTIGQMLPFTATILGTATIGGLTAGPAGAVGGAYASGVALNSGMAFEEYIKSGIPIDEATTAAGVYGAIATFLENSLGIIPANFAGKLFTKGAKDVISKSFTEFIKKELPSIANEIAKTTAGEAAEEGLQQISQNLIEKYFNTNKGIFDDVLESVAGGAIGGLAFGAATTIATNEDVRGKIKEVAGDKRGQAMIPGGKSTQVETFEGFDDLTLTTLEKLKGRSTVSKEFISNLTNSGDLKQSERDVIREALETEGDTVNVKAFADKVKAELLPLTTQSTDVSRKDLGIDPDADLSSGDFEEFAQDGIILPRYENITLPDDIRGKVKNYKENIYESPISTSAGNNHFSGQTKNYFGHTRVEDMADNQTRRIIEVQSDLYQKGNLEREMPKGGIAAEKAIADNARANMRSYREDSLPYKEEAKRLAESEKRIRIYESGGLPANVQARADELSKLSQYNNPTAHFRMIREEIKKAAQDGKTKLQFPTGETAMKIEGLEKPDLWKSLTDDGKYEEELFLKPNSLSVGKRILRGLRDEWIITDVLGDGKFKAVPKQFENQLKTGKTETGYNFDVEGVKESFDISGKVDTNNPIYKFYEKEVRKYLNKFGGKEVTDDKGISWIEVSVDPNMAKQPVTAFKVGGKLKVEYDTSLDEAYNWFKDRFDNDEVSLMFPRKISFDGGELFGEYFSGGNTLLGRRLDALVKVVQSGGKIPSVVLYHESFHAYFNAFITEEQRTKLIQDVIKNHSSDLVKYENKVYSTIEKRAEEWLADDFAKYVRDKDSYNGAYRSVWQRFLDKVLSLVKKVDAFNGLYEDILTKKRPAQAITGAEQVSSFKYQDFEDVGQFMDSEMEDGYSNFYGLLGHPKLRNFKEKLETLDADGLKKFMVERGVYDNKMQVDNALFENGTGLTPDEILEQFRERIMTENPQRLVGKGASEVLENPYKNNIEFINSDLQKSIFDDPKTAKEAMQQLINFGVISEGAQMSLADLMTEQPMIMEEVAKVKTVSKEVTNQVELSQLNRGRMVSFFRPSRAAASRAFSLLGNKNTTIPLFREIFENWTKQGVKHIIEPYGGAFTLGTHSINKAIENGLERFESNIFDREKFIIIRAIQDGQFEQVEAGVQDTLKRLTDKVIEKAKTGNKELYDFLVDFKAKKTDGFVGGDAMLDFARSSKLGRDVTVLDGLRKSFAGVFQAALNDMANPKLDSLQNAIDFATIRSVGVFSGKGQSIILQDGFKSFEGKLFGKYGMVAGLQDMDKTFKLAQEKGTEIVVENMDGSEFARKAIGQSKYSASQLGIYMDPPYVKSSNVYSEQEGFEDMKSFRSDSFVSSHQPVFDAANSGARLALTNDVEDAYISNVMNALGRTNDKFYAYKEGKTPTSLIVTDETFPVVAQHIENAKLPSSGGVTNTESDRIKRLISAVLQPEMAQGLKDISGFKGHVRDIYRNFEAVLGKGSPLSEIILDEFDDSKGRFVAEQKRLTKALDRTIVKGLKIKPGSKASRLVMDYGEGLITQKELSVRFGQRRAVDIMNAADWFRKGYDQLLDEVNVVRARIYPNSPDKLIPRRKDYFRHYQEMSTGWAGFKNIFDTPAGISPELAGISPFTRPRSRFLSFAQQRIGMRSERDAVGGFVNYIKPFAFAKHIDPNISNFRILATVLANETVNTKNVNNFISFLHNYSNDLAGKTNPADRYIQEIMPYGRQSFAVLNWVNSRVKAGVILGNFGSAIAQIFNVPQGIASAKQHAAMGAVRTFGDVIFENKAMSQSSFISERYSNTMYDKFQTGMLKHPKRVAAWITGALDEVGTKFIWNSHYEKALRENMPNPVRYADQKTRKLVGGRGVGEVPLLQKAKVFQLVAPFQLEVGNLWFAMGDMKREKDLAGFAILFIVSFLMNKVAERLRGSDVIFDPIQALWEAFLLFQSEEDKRTGAVVAAGRLAGEVIGNVPLGQTVGSAYPQYGFSIGNFKAPTREKFFGGADPTRFGSGLFAAQSLSDPLYKILPPFSGGQIKKTVGGVKALLDGDVSSKDGKKLYDTKKADAVQLVLFGKYSTTEAREYFKDQTFKSKVDTEMLKLYRANQKLEAEGKSAEAQASLRTLSPAGYDLYKEVRATERRKETVKKKMEFLPIARKNKKLKESNPQEYQKYIKSLSSNDYRIYKLAEKQLEVTSENKEEVEREVEALLDDIVKNQTK